MEKKLWKLGSCLWKILRCVIINMIVVYINISENDIVVGVKRNLKYWFKWLSKVLGLNLWKWIDNRFVRFLCCWFLVVLFVWWRSWFFCLVVVEMMSVLWYSDFKKWWSFLRFICCVVNFDLNWCLSCLSEMELFSILRIVNFFFLNWKYCRVIGFLRI